MTGSAEAGSARRAGQREWIALAVLALPGLLITLAFSVLTARRAEAERRSEPYRDSVAVDCGHLRVHTGRPSGHDGHAW